MLTTNKRVTSYRARQHQLRALVDSYFTIQELRKGADNKQRSYRQGYDVPSAHVPKHEGNGLLLPEPEFMCEIRDDLGGIEDRIAKYLKAEAQKDVLGQWAMSIDGISGVLAAGLLAYIDFFRCGCPQWAHFIGKERKEIPDHDCPGLKTAAAIHSFAGLFPKEWLPGQRRPYNVKLKTHLWKIADQFSRQSVSSEKMDMSDEEFKATLRKDKKYKDLDDEELDAIVATKRRNMEKRLAKMETRLYVRLYLQRKERDTQYNEEGRFAAKAKEMLEGAIAKRRKISAEQKKWWSQGMLQPCGIELRARRYAETIFTSHFHQIGREVYFGDVVKPWVIVHGGHTDYIPPPNWPLPTKK